MFWQRFKARAVARTVLGGAAIATLAFVTACGQPQAPSVHAHRAGLQPGPGAGPDPGAGQVPGPHVSPVP
jgi:hypothetical protein